MVLWGVVLHGHLYAATDKSGVPKLWVRQLGRDPEARLGIQDRMYRVRGHRILDNDRWNAVLAEYAKKHGVQFQGHDFPEPGNTRRGRIYELESRV